MPASLKDDVARTIPDGNGSAPIPAVPSLFPPWMLILFAALAIRAYSAVNLGCLSRDGVQFVTYAKRLAVEPLAVLRDTTKQPGYSALMLAVNRITINRFYQEHPIIWQGCGQFVAIAGGVASCLLIYVLALRLFDNKRTAFVAGLLAAAWPQGVLLSADVLSDMPHFAFYLAAMLIGLTALDRHSLWRFAACGAIAGMAYLIRQEAIGLVGAIGLCALWPSDWSALRTRAVGVLLMLVTFAAVVAPYPIATGRLMPNKSIDELLFGREDVATTQLPDMDLQCKDVQTGNQLRTFRLTKQFRQVQTAHQIPWQQAPARMVEEWCKSGRYVISTLVLIALFLKSVPRAQSRGARLVLIAAALQLLAVQLRVKSYGEISSRYLVIPAGLCIPWAAAAMTTLVSVIAERLARATGEAADPTSPVTAVRRLKSLWLSASIIVFVPLVFYATMPINADKAPYKLAGWWLRTNTKRTDRVFAHDRLEQIMFYAGRTWPETTWVHGDDGRSAPSVERVANVLIADGPDYIVEARNSREATAEVQDAFYEAVVQLSDLNRPLWTSGESEHEVSIFRLIKPLNLPTMIANPKLTTGKPN